MGFKRPCPAWLLDHIVVSACIQADLSSALLLAAGILPPP